MISVETALNHLFDLVTPLDVQYVPLVEAAGRVLAQPIIAKRDQPPFNASAMDGYAVRQSDVQPGVSLEVIGESAAGHGFHGVVEPGQTVRIFTGAPVPENCDRVIIQEDVERIADDITLNFDLDKSKYVRPLGADFKVGDELSSPRLLTPSDIALIASMNVAQVPVYRKPDIAILATGDELVQPGDQPGMDQIIASNSYGLHALLTQAGAQTRMLPIARDNLDSLKMAFELAQGADVIVTIGGASVGDHDLVGDVAQQLGMDQRFYKVAMRPGKPLMAGKLGRAAMIGLPGNPVSAMVCGHVFLVPVINKLLGLGAHPAPVKTLPLAAPLRENGGREHYMRARSGPEGVTVFDRQDSALITVLAQADCLVRRMPNAPALDAGDMVDVLALV